MNLLCGSQLSFLFELCADERLEGPYFCHVGNDRNDTDRKTDDARTDTCKKDNACSLNCVVIVILS